MNTYKLTLSLESSIVTPLQADTVWGHICWGLKYNEGESRLENFINQYRDEIPLILSNAFPKGMLPKPLLKRKYPSTFMNLYNYSYIKKEKKIRYISVANFPNGILKEENIQIKKTVDTLHNTINRFTGTVLEEGGLYAIVEDWFENNEFDIYVLSIYDLNEIEKLFNYAFMMGYGADKSTGKGVIKIINIENTIIPLSGNKLMALANFTVPKGVRLNDFYADVMVKYGKLGGDFVFYKNPFKKPIIMYREGATFENVNGFEYIGEIIKDIHGDEKICHYTYAPLIGIEISEDFSQ